MTNLNIIDAFERQLYGKKLGNENKYKKKVDRKPDIINPHEYYNEGELYCNKKIKIYDINDIYHLIQFIGYGKYKNPEYKIFLRGQTRLYERDEKIIMKPTLYRAHGEVNVVSESLYRKFYQIMKNNRKDKSFDYRYEVLASLLQHYGLKTNQLDVVDNVWIALWFASHGCESLIIKQHEYLKYNDSNEEYSYIFLMATDAQIDKGKGLYQGRETFCVDLRKAVPSIFIRPHAQHAYMISKNNKYEEDYTDLIIGIARMKTSNVLKWIGNTELLSTASLFPSPLYDDGYSALLNKFVISEDGVDVFGAIQIIS